MRYCDSIATVDAPLALLLLACAALLVGPLVAGAVPAGSRARLGLDAVVAVLVGLLCLGLLLPHAVEALGLTALLVAALALGLPEAARRLRPSQHRAWDLVGLGLLALHDAVDGAALAAVEAGLGPALGLAIALHRLPVGLVVYQHARAAGGRRVGWGAVVLLVVATVLGYAAGGSVDLAARPWLAGALEAAVAGLLLHVVVEHVGHLLEARLSSDAPG